jgi:hypothetical protein
VKLQDLDGREPSLVAEQLGQVADAAAGVAVAQWPAENGSLAAARPGQAKEQLDDRRLAGPVGTQEAEDLAAVHAEVQAVQRERCPVRFPEPGGLDGGSGHGAILASVGEPCSIPCSANCRGPP